MAVINSTHHNFKGVAISIHEGLLVVDALLVYFYISFWGGNLRKLCDNLVNGECHHFDVKGYGLGARGC